MLNKMACLMKHNERVRLRLNRKWDVNGKSDANSEK